MNPAIARTAALVCALSPWAAVAAVRSPSGGEEAAAADEALVRVEGPAVAPRPALAVGPSAALAHRRDATTPKPDPVVVGDRRAKRVHPPLRLRFVDAYDGRSLPAPSVDQMWFGCEPGPAERLPGDDAGDLVVERYAPERTGFEMGGPPEGYVDWVGPLMPGRLLVARHAQSLLYTWPLHREAQVTLFLAGPDGGRAQGATVTGFRIDGRGGAVGIEERHGVLRLRGIPFLPGEPLELHAGWSPETVDATLALVLPDVPRGMAATLVLPPKTERTETAFEGPTDGWASCTCGSGCCGPYRGPVGSVVVVARRRGGSPAAGAAVAIGWEEEADAAGEATFVGVPVGLRKVRLREPGLVPVSVAVEVREGRTCEVVLQEPEGASLDVTVVDETGRTARFARLAVEQPSSVPWLDVSHDGVQRIDGFVDERGRRTLGRVEPGDVKVTAVWGRRRGEAVVPAGERGAERVVIRVSPGE